MDHTVVKVECIPPNKTYIIIRHPDNRVEQFPREYAKYARVGDIGIITQASRPSLKLLTDDSEVVIMSNSATNALVVVDPITPPVTPPPAIKTP